MSYKKYLYSIFSTYIPETRMYPFKVYLLNTCGYSVNSLARIVSSSKFIGSFDLNIGRDTFIGHDVLITGGRCSIEIGDECDLGPRVCIIAGSHEIDMIGAHTAGKGVSKNIIIEDGAWLGANVTVLGGVRIGSKSIIGAGSLVVDDIPSRVLAYGVPCKVKKVWDVGSQKWTDSSNDI